MNLKNTRNLVVGITILAIFIVAFPLVDLILPSVDGEMFTELWLLDENQTFDANPVTVSEGERLDLFLGLKNHVGSSQYYKIFIKFGNSSQTILDLDAAVSSSLPVLYEYNVFVSNEAVWNSTMTIAVEDAVVQGNVMHVSNLVINGINIPVDVSAVIDDEQDGFFFKFICELWKFNSESNDLKYDDRFVGLWVFIPRS